MPRLFDVETREWFFDLVCGGVPIREASESVGMSKNTGHAWWRKSGRMELQIQRGQHGGLVGDAAPAVVGTDGLRRQLSSEDRAVIAAGVRQELSYAEIGALIGRDKSVVWREVNRNRGNDGSYHGAVAHRVAHERRRRPKEFKLAANPGLCRRIEAHMDEGWSPGLIAQVLGAEGAAKMDRVSHETIYKALYVQGRGHLRADLHKQLSLKRSERKPRGVPRQASIYREAFTISQRPPEVEDRAVPGHWEGDLIIGAGGKSAVGTLVERMTRFTMLLHLPGSHDAATVAEAMIREMGQLPEHLRRSITWDRGTELANYADIQLELDTKVFFCDPRAPWQRGTNENTNRLLRFWLAKSTDLSTYSQADLRKIADTLNRRPRPTLELQTPADRLNQLLANAA